jgi:hypothetical protein
MNNWHNLLLFSAVLALGCESEAPLELHNGGASLGSIGEYETPLHTGEDTEASAGEATIEWGAGWDRTGVLQQRGGEFFETTDGRLVFSIYDTTRTDLFAYIESSSGTTLRVIYEGWVREGIHEFSFNSSALEPGTYRWFVQDKLINDTLQFQEFQVID